MDLKQIRCTLAAAECGSFRRAAHDLRLQQSAVSRKILDLESRLGVVLFIRRANGVTLTDAGKCFVTLARKGVMQLEVAENLAKAMGRGEFGVLRVGISSLASGILAELTEAHAGHEVRIRLDWSEGNQSDLIRAVEQGDLDVALVSGSPAVPGCESVPLWRERVFVVMPEWERLTEKAEIPWQDLGGQNFIVGGDETGRRMRDYLVKHLAGVGCEVSIERCQVSRENLLRLAALGRGFTLITEAGISDQVIRNVSRPIVASSIPFSAVRLNAIQNITVDRFIDRARILLRRYAPISQE